MEKFVVTSFLFKLCCFASIFIDFPFISAVFCVKIIKLLELLFCYCSLISFDAGMSTLMIFTCKIFSPY